MSPITIFTTLALLLALATAESHQEKQAVAAGLSAADKQVILNKHNELRRKVAKGLETNGKPGPQPSASNMRELSWDDELANAAQVLTNQCVFAHSPNRKTTNWPYYGQNLAMGNGPLRWDGMIQMWYDEVKDSSKDAISKFTMLPSTGHYTQLVWADTYKIGCGYTKCSSGGIYACNYGPGGNMKGAPMYKVGRAASACPKGTSAKDGLCT